MSNKVYKIIQDKFVNAIQDVIDGKETLLPWQKPWKGCRPMNYVTRRPYSGVNAIMLEGGEWITFKQIKDLSSKDKSIKLKKGSKGTMVIFWKINDVEKKNDEGDKEKHSYPIIRYTNVFNITDVEGLETKIPANNSENKSIEDIELVVNNYITREGIELNDKSGSSRAYYQPATDSIVIPRLDQFDSTNSYYQTLFHEMAHSTGHEKRLKRPGIIGKISFGSANYSKEELVADISSQMILESLNISDESIYNNSLAYVNGWLNAIKKDISLIISASSQAQKATDYILGE